MVWKLIRILRWRECTLATLLAFIPIDLHGAVGVNSVWDELTPLPDAHGFAGPFAGVSGGALIVAGGANFPDGPPSEGGAKVWHDNVFALSEPNGEWRQIGQLPRGIGYGVSVTWKGQLIGIGGSDPRQHYSEVFALSWNGTALELKRGASLPVTLANAAGVLVGDVIYLAGGSLTPQSTEASNQFWKLDLSRGWEGSEWVALDSWPGPERMLPVMAFQNGKVILVSGARLLPDGEGGVTREFLRDAYAFDPSAEAWATISAPPVPFVAAPNPGVPLGYADVLFSVGDDGEYFFRQNELQGEHPGFPVQMYRYNTVIDKWTTEGEFPRVLRTTNDERQNGGTYPPVTTSVVEWEGQFVFPSGEIRPTVRTSKVMSLRIGPSESVFGVVNWNLVLSSGIRDR
jgi:N-acetylneuraminic acid mutarotase